MKYATSSALTIAGTDPTGGAGIQADLKSFQEREVYGMSVVTSVVAQNTLGVQSIEHLSVSFIEKQLESVFNDIVTEVVKKGICATPKLKEVVIQSIESKHDHYII